MSDPALTVASCEERLQAEFPALRLVYTAVDGVSGRSPEAVHDRLRTMSNRITGAVAVQLRQEPVPWAYRVFFRQVGIDPDERRTPVEQLILDRLQAGGFRSRNLLDDAITIATVETGVPVVAFDAERVYEPLELRLSYDGELLGEAGRPLSASQIVVADQRQAVAVLFADMDPACGVTPQTQRMLLCAIQVAGVPDIAVEEALWVAAEIVTGAA
jgi:DNA/RNA-binding domain of Phe-tRNA-synthetase-like protein